MGWDFHVMGSWRMKKRGEKQYPFPVRVDQD
jgi:hypothetical protein